MLTNLFDATTIPVLEQVVSFTQTRHNILAGNVANLDTPGYRTRDLSPEMFQQRLSEALETRDTTPAALRGVATGYLGDPIAEVGENLEGILFHDESNVALEKQLAEIMKNQGLHNQALAILRSQYALLHAAISERA